jgi:hypothetical protein
VTLVEPIKAELGLSDFSIAFLSGGTAVLVLMGKLEKRDVRAAPLYAALTVLIGTFPSILAYAGASRQVTLFRLWIFGPTYVLVQNLTLPSCAPNRPRSCCCSPTSRIW